MGVSLLHLGDLGGKFFLLCEVNDFVVSYTYYIIDIIIIIILHLKRKEFEMFIHIIGIL